MSGKKKSGSARAVPRAYGRLTRHERDTVQRMLERGASCREIARELGRSPSTVSAEVASHRFVTAPKARRGERVDASADLSAACPRLAAWPRCCNGCGRYRAIGCKRRPHVFYEARAAQLCADSVLVSSRRGIDADEPAAAARLEAIRNCLHRGLSPEQMAARNGGPVDLSPSTIYRWVSAGYDGMTNYAPIGYPTREERDMERNVMGELNVYRGSGAKPNFSEIARRHGMDRHTVAKYWREGESAADGRSARGSAFDPLEEEIRAKAQLPGMTKMAVYAFLREGRGEGLPGYGAFTAWCRAHDVPFGGAGGREPHPRFETPPGRQLQFDWKEGMRLVDSEGEAFEFSVFTATLGYSRKHRFIPVRSRTLDDLLSCLLATFTRLGGVPEECITDNMSCLVTVSGRRRTRQERAWRFAREAGFELRLCAPRSPQTKGKDESANRFLNRLLAYGGEFTGWSGLAEAVARVEAQANSEPNRTTGLPPDALFMREKESLRPIGNLRLLESMVGDVSVQTVPPTMLVRAAGREWSVPRRCIGRRVSVVAMPGGQVVVRMAGEEVAVHDAASGPSRPINYDPDHYGQALEGKRGLADADIAEAARANLALLDSLGGA